MNTKPIYRSKTFWLQIVAILSALIPPVGEWVASNPVKAISVLGAVGVLVRFATHGKVTLFHDEGKKSGGSGVTPAFALLAAGGLSMAGLVLLPSCTVVGSAITGAPIPSTSVQRSGSKDADVIQVVTLDLLAAEEAARRAKTLGEPPPTHGLYDAGRAAKAVREVFTEGSK